MNLINKQTHPLIISSYSKKSSIIYDDPGNKNFLYGKLTIDFLKKIKIKKKNSILVDIGCGTGIVFDILYKKIKKKNISCFGIDPATGMLKLAKKKFKNEKNIYFLKGSFGKIPLKSKSVDKIISTLALHWVPSINIAIKELKRVLKSDGSIEIFMIEKDDGKKFKIPIFKAIKKHLSLKQIFKVAQLTQRLSINQTYRIFGKYFDLKNEYKLSIKNTKKIIYGTYEQHMKWWRIRSGQIIAKVTNKNSFNKDLKNELEKIKKTKGIPFDLSVLYIKLKNKST